MGSPNNVDRFDNTLVLEGILKGSFISKFGFLLKLFKCAESAHLNNFTDSISPLQKCCLCVDLSPSKELEHSVEVLMLPSCLFSIIDKYCASR
jgi:hypothetical protein